MKTIINNRECQTILTLLTKGSQAITIQEIFLVNTLRHQASEYEKIKYAKHLRAPNPN